MKPALSVILFTVLSGAGVGALVLLALGDLAARALGRAMPPLTTASVIALGLVVAGLCASTLHLAKPRNAWRSLSRWRSSWLSREAVAALLFLPLAALCIAAHAAGANVLAAALGAGVVVIGSCMLYCTAMIYASLKPIRQWHTARVPVAFVLLGHASGALLIVAAMPAGEAVGGWVAASLGLFVLALLVKLEYWRFVAHRSGPTLERAIGVEHGVGPPRSGRAVAGTIAARLLDAGHTKGTFLTREFLYAMPASRRRLLRAIALIAGFAVPLLWLATGHTDGRAGAAAFVVCIVGLVAERWLFFAEARHTVRLYHGEAAV
jgi:DMSO reductase anchor subunit